MNTIKHIIFSSLVILLFLSSAGCSFLDQEIYDTSSSWRTQKDITDAINGMYTFTREEGVTGRGLYWFENCSDNMVTGRPNSSADEIRNFKMTPSNGADAQDTYAEMYKVIARANSVLINSSKVPNVDTEFLNEAYGEAYFMRAFACLWIVPFYADDGENGGLPNILDTTPAEGQDLPRAESILDNYDQIIADMEKAAELLPDYSTIYNERAIRGGRPHKTAAWAYAARAALYASQYRDKGTQDKYRDMVIKFCDNVINMSGANKRDLFDDGSANPFKNLWTEKNNFSSEYIFGLLGNSNAGPKFHGMGFQNGGWGSYNHWGYYQPTYELLMAYETGDKRREATIILPGEKMMYVGDEIHFGVNPKDISSTTKMSFRKFLSPWEPWDCSGKTVSSNGNDASNNLTTCLIRYADVLLMKAEALIWKNGEGDAEAKRLLKKKRKRARLPENSQATIAQLKNERRCELASEFQPSRHLDLVRWGDAQSTYAQPAYGVDYTINADNTVTVRKSAIPAWDARSFNPQINHVFPIPEKAVSSSLTLKQNKGY